MEDLHTWRTLSQLLKDQPFRALDEQSLLRVVRGVVNGLLHLHQSGVVHRDLQLCNVMVDEQLKVKIIDLGCAFRAQSANNPAQFGTKGYLAPEAQLKKKVFMEPNKLDIWALGRIIRILYFGSEQDRRMQEQSEASEYEAENKSTYLMSEGLRDFLERCLDPCPQTRASIEELQEHPWLK